MAVLVSWDRGEQMVLKLVLHATPDIPVGHHEAERKNDRVRYIRSHRCALRDARLVRQNLYMFTSPSTIKRSSKMADPPFTVQAVREWHKPMSKNMPLRLGGGGVEAIDSKQKWAFKALFIRLRVISCMSLV